MLKQEPTGEAINIKRVEYDKRIEFPLEDFCKFILEQLPCADKVNDVIKLSDGESYVISTFKLGVIKSEEEEKEEGEEIKDREEPLEEQK